MAAGGEESVSDWISVKDRYPHPGTKVLVYFADELCPYMGVWRYDTVNRYFRPEPSRDVPLRQCVTHWMILPDPPEGVRP